MTRAMRRAAPWPAWLALLLAVLAPAPGACDEPGEPPPEAGEGDYALERPDTLADRELETRFDASGRAGEGPRRGQQVRFHDAGTHGSVRDGGGAGRGGRLEAPLGAGRLGFGRLSPRWGRGLVLGAPAEPWSDRPSDRGTRGAFQGRAGEGVSFGAGDADRFGALAGRFGGRGLAGAHAGLGPARFGALGARAGAQGSAALEAGDADLELALDRRGRWRAEAALEQRHANAALALRVRGGLAGFRSLAEPRRSGPARVLALTTARWAERLRARASGALWSFAPGVSGGRASLEVERRLVQHAGFLCGMEEQHGTRRDPALFATPGAGNGMRQGFWCEWNAAVSGRSLALRHELWGARAFAREAVRRVLVARGETALPRGASLAVTHAAWSTRRGERSYLHEDDGDLLILRAVSGAGARTRVECEAPALAGTARAGVTIVSGASKRALPTWTVAWTRRTRW